MVQSERSGSIPRERAFQDFHKQAGLKPFAPEFLDSLIATMRYSECLTERIHAWGRWRAWGNSSLYAVSDWDAGRPLDQLDCIIELAWFKAGKPVEWVIGAPEHVREAERNTGRSLKGQYSRAFARLVSERRLEIKGRKIYPVVSPDNLEVKPKVAGSSNFQGDEEFMKWWEVADSSNFQAFKVAWTTFVEARKVARNAYRQYQETATPEPPIIIPVKVVSNTAAADGPEQQPAAAVLSGPTADETATVHEAMSRYGPCDLDTAERVIENSRQECPDVSADEVVQMIVEKGRNITRSTQRPIGLLFSIVPKGFRGYRRPEPTPPSSPVEPVCKLCADTGWLGDIVGVEACSCKNSS
jgi:hypothetical protein